MTEEFTVQKRHTNESTVRRVTAIGMGVNLGLSILKFVVGSLANSQALIADGVHSLSDWATDIVILVGVRFWMAPPDECHPYGHGRIETLISVIIGFLLASVGVGLAVRAVVTLRDSHSQPTMLAFWVAIAAMVSKELLYQWSFRVGKKIKSSAIIANAWHHRSDALSSVPVAIAVIGAAIWPSLTYLDHIATIIVSVFIMQAAAKIVMPSLRELIDSGVSDKHRESIEKLVLEIKGVESLHALRTRHVGNGIQVDLHVQVAPTLTVVEGHDIATKVKRHVETEDDDVLDVLVHIEPHEDESA